MLEAGGSRYFYPRSPCGERHSQPQPHYHQQTFLSTLSLRRATTQDPQTYHQCRISIHALLAESDRNADCSCHSVRPISIHALLAESDCPKGYRWQNQRHFYPRSPCGERRVSETLVPRQNQFLSTLSLRRATARRASRQQPAGISIHALLAESDNALRQIVNRRKYFYPRSPCGERQAPEAIRGDSNSYFYPRSPCGERHTMTTTICIA